MLFDEWPERYERWFATPIGGLVRKFEVELILEMLEPRPGEMVLDAGCGTGIFTTDFLKAGAAVTGLDISGPMLDVAGKKSAGYPFYAVLGDMLRLPLKDSSFDKVVSVTALEFIEGAQAAVDEMFRVVRPGGLVVAATLNGLSSWADRRRAKTRRGQRHVLENAFFRAPDELLALSPLKGVVRTAVHFQKDEEPDRAVEIEQAGRSQGLDTGAFVAVGWVKPDLKEIT